VRDRLAEICAHVEASLDFPEEEIEIATEKEILGGIESLSAQLGRLADTYEGGRFFREGFSIAIVGKPNVGKSSLLNALLERDRAIVTDIPGTTRDTIEEYLNIRGLPVRIMDTAGIRESHDLPEQEGVSRSLRAIEGADLVIGLFDASAVVSHEDREVVERIKGKKAISVLNKTDLPEMFDPALCSGPVVKVSALYRRGIDELKEEILDQAMRGKGEHKEGVVVTNIRHKTLVELAREALGRAREEMMNHSPLEITAIHLRDALQRLGEIVGIVTTDDILNKIFSDFCIGK
jgi:tRNA modification GTPase